MKEMPKFSEVLRAAAKGWLAPYTPPVPAPGQISSCGPFDSASHDRARSTAAAFEAIAELYEKYEEGENA